MNKLIVIGLLTALAGGCFEAIEIPSEEELEELRKKAMMAEAGELDPAECAEDANHGLLGGACTVGLGQCKRTAEHICTLDGVVCGARAPSANGLSETCANEVDDDCDGEIDEAPEGGCCSDRDCAGEMVCIDDRGGRCIGESPMTGGVMETGGVITSGGTLNSGGNRADSGVVGTGGTSDTGGNRADSGVVGTGGGCNGALDCVGCSVDADCGSDRKRCVDEVCARRPTCGDGFLDLELGELCDDGNNRAGDNCSADCRQFIPYRINCDPSTVGKIGFGFCVLSCEEDSECPRVPTAETGQASDDLWEPVCAIPEWNLMGCFIKCDELDGCPSGYECTNPAGFTYGICGPADAN